MLRAKGIAYLYNHADGEKFLERYPLSKYIYNIPLVTTNYPVYIQVVKNEIANGKREVLPISARKAKAEIEKIIDNITNPPEKHILEEILAIAERDIEQSSELYTATNILKKGCIYIVKYTSNDMETVFGNGEDFLQHKDKYIIEHSLIEARRDVDTLVKQKMVYKTDSEYAHISILKQEYGINGTIETMELYDIHGKKMIFEEKENSPSYER